MPSVLRRLQTERFALTVREPVARVPLLPGFDPRLTDNHTLEIEVAASRNLNEVFAALSAQHIDVLSMRSKVSRLEELFVRLVGKQEVGGKSSRGEPHS